MTREDAIIWLNKRLELSNNKQLFHISDEDIIFIRNYIHYYKKELLEPARIVKSIQQQIPGVFINYLDSMMTILINDFKIETKTEKRKVQDVNINMSMRVHPFATQELDFIIEYH